MRRLDVLFRALLLAGLAGLAGGERCVHAHAVEGKEAETEFPPTPLPEPLTAWQRARERISWDYLRAAFSLLGSDMSEAFCSMSEDGCATIRLGNTHVEMRLEEVTEALADVPEKAARGEIRRMGDLGFFILNDLLWASDWKTFPLGADIQDCRLARPVMDALTGSKSKAWSRDMLRLQAGEFFRGRESLSQRDVHKWVNKLLHKILMDMEITDEEEEVFQEYKDKWIRLAVLPRWLLSLLRWPLGLQKARDVREELIAKYEAAIDSDDRCIFPPRLEGRDKRFIADTFLTAMTSAGGLSLPLGISVALAVLHGAETYGEVVLPDWQDFKLTDANVKRFVLECLRRFPLVVGFPWWDSDLNHRTVLNLGMSLRDPRAWEAPREFRLRPLSEYHQKKGAGTKIGTAFAQQAAGHSGRLTPDSRGCPAQELSVVVISEFLRAFARTQKDWRVKTPGGSIIQITESPIKTNAWRLVRFSGNAD